MRVLVLDDEPIIGTTLARLLRRIGSECVVASSTDEAIGLLRSGPFDVVLADENLEPGLTGLDFLRLLSREFPEIRRVLMSACEVAGWQGIAHALLGKPFADDTLRAALRLQPSPQKSPAADGAGIHKHPTHPPC